MGKPRTAAAEHAHESSPVMTVPLWILAIGSVAGVLLNWPFGDRGPHDLGFRLDELTRGVFAAANVRLHHAGEEPFWPYFLAWGLALLGTFVGWLLYLGPAREVPTRLAQAMPGVYRFWVDKFRVDELYELLIVKPFEGLSYVLWRIVDVGIIDGLVNGVGRVASWFAGIFRLFQNGDVQRYAALMAVAAAIILGLALRMGAHP